MFYVLHFDLLITYQRLGLLSVRASSQVSLVPPELRETSSEVTRRCLYVVILKTLINLEAVALDEDWVLDPGHSTNRQSMIK